MDEMKALLEEAMKDGAFGLSSMLAMPPGSLATTDDLVELCKVVEKHHGIYSSHIRNEGTGVFDAVKEAIAIGEQADVPVDIIHLKIADQKYWGRMNEVVALIEEARKRGVNVQANVYPYTRGNNDLANGITAYGFYDLSVGGVLVDTVQPTEGEFPTHGGPPSAVFVNTFNMNGDPSGNNCLTVACSGLEVWGLSNPATKNQQLTGVEVATPQYISPPNADQPGCSQCVETIDTRITGTPVFNNGQVSWSIDTGAMNKTQVVPAILWGQVVPQFVNGNLKAASMYQVGYFGFEGDQDASFGALMPDVNGNLIMVYDTMSSKLNPSAVFTGRRSSFLLGFFHDAGKFLQKGLAPTNNSRWGDYEATSYDGFSTDHIWMASQYSGANQDWATVIGETQFRFK